MNKKILFLIVADNEHTRQVLLNTLNEAFEPESFDHTFVPTGILALISAVSLNCSGEMHGRYRDIFILLSCENHNKTEMKTYADFIYKVKTTTVGRNEIHHATNLHTILISEDLADQQDASQYLTSENNPEQLRSIVNLLTTRHTYSIGCSNEALLAYEEYSRSPNIESDFESLLCVFNNTSLGSMAKSVLIQQVGNYSLSKVDIFLEQLRKTSTGTELVEIIVITEDIENDECKALPEANSGLLLVKPEDFTSKLLELKKEGSRYLMDQIGFG